jgi:hypothetical protein
MKLDSQKLYIQIGAVNAHFDSQESQMRITPHEMSFNLGTFMLETGFSVSGKNVAELSQQQKKKIIFYVDKAFPYMTNRLEVVNVKEIILSPLENAVELLEGRVAALRAQLTQNPPRLNALQSVIQGSVVTMVNEGPLKICEIFLASGAVDRDGKPYDPQKVAVLKEKMTDFIKMCGFAIKLNKSLISAEHLPFQQMVEQKYESLKEMTKLYTNI